MKVLLILLRGMAGTTLSLDAPEPLSAFLYRTESDPRSVVVMTCGISGTQNEGIVANWSE